jgi:hypothetical protein
MFLRVLLCLEPIKPKSGPRMEYLQVAPPVPCLIAFGLKDLPNTKLLDDPRLELVFTHLSDFLLLSFFFRFC